MSFRAFFLLFLAWKVAMIIERDKPDIYRGETSVKYSIFVFLESVDHTLAVSSKVNTC